MQSLQNKYYKSNQGFIKRCIGYPGKDGVYIKYTAVVADYFNIK